jgi:uncharacterized LabA/DUF88 family protein
VTTGVYIDGFNFYYGAVKGTPYKWLDLEELCRQVLPRETVTRICYFTAHVNGSKDPLAPQRQQTYLRALATLPTVEVHLGLFKSRPTTMPLHPLPVTGTKTVQVMKTEEKGSDVNLGCHSLLDALRGTVDTVVIISNDSDLLEPVRLIRNETPARIGVVNPHPHYKRSRTLVQHANFTKQLTETHLIKSQFPTSLADATGTITKPKEW